HVVRRGRVDRETAGAGAAQPAAAALGEGVGAGGVEQQVVEGGDETGSAPRSGGATGEAARPTGQREGYLVAVVTAHHVAVLVEYLHLHRRTDGGARRGVPGLDAEGQVVRRGRVDREAGRVGAAHAAWGAGGEGVGAGRVEQQVVESGD